MAAHEAVQESEETLLQIPNVSTLLRPVRIVPACHRNITPSSNVAPFIFIAMPVFIKKHSKQTKTGKKIDGMDRHVVDCLPSA